jgi:hypothetical protein
MNPLKRFYNTHTELDEQQAEQLRNPDTDWHTVEVRIPKHTDLPPCPVSFIDGIREMKTKWLRLRNTSPAIAFEIRRGETGQLRFQYSVPTKRLERKLRNHLADATPKVEILDSGEDGLPVEEGDSIGGCTFSMTRQDWNPLETDHDAPPTNPVIGALHEQAMKDTKFVVQVLFRSVAGKPLRRWWHRHSAHSRIDRLRSEKEQLIGSRKPTSSEKKRGRLIDEKVNRPSFKTEIRVAVIGAGEHTPSRVHELSGAFNSYGHAESGQSLSASVEESIRAPPLIRFGEAIADRRFQESHRRFRVTPKELAGLVALPDRIQKNISYAKAHDT